MLFSSLSFLYFFLPTIVILNFISPSVRWKNAVLLLGSLLFYSWGDPTSAALLLTESFLAFAAALIIDHKRTRKTPVLWAAAFVLVAVLVYYKYLNFIIDGVRAITNADISFRQFILPAGISFFTFQLLSYLFDVYRGSINADKNFFHFLLYVSFFPQLLQGPIIRYGSISNQIVARKESWDEVISGVKRFIIGLGKKVMIADNIALVVSAVYSAPEYAGTTALWLGAVSYSLQLYFDFSGYCDMAIGLGRIFGFSIPENFNYPYAATSITDFWRRWHISLSLWFRDYIYIPLGGNRVSKSRMIFNILAVWSLTGLWHGASWNFVFWGLYYGLLLLAEKLLLQDKLDTLPLLLRRCATLFFVILGWVLFNLSDTQTLFPVLKEMFIFSPTDWVSLFALDTSICSKLLFVPIGIVFSFPVARTLNFKSESLLYSLICNSAYLVILMFSIMYIISSSFTPFIYFSF